MVFGNFLYLQFHSLSNAVFMHTLYPVDNLSVGLGSIKVKEFEFNLHSDNSSFVKALASWSIHL